MKKIILLCLGVIMSIATYAEEAKKVAILEVVDKEGKLSYSQKLMLRSNLSRAVANTEGFEAYDRSDMDAIFSEHDFQRTGNVSQDQIRQLGEMTGAAYILVSEGVLAEEGKVFLTAKILNVETAKVEITDNVLLANSSASMQRGCRQLASKMFGALAGTATATNKFLNLFKKKDDNSNKNAQDSIAAAKKSEREAAKEQQRLAEEKARHERALAEEKAKKERIEAEEKARQEREAAEANVREQQRLEKERKEAELAERQKLYITRYDNKHWEHLGTLMDKKAYEAFILSHCDKASLQYQKGKKLTRVGWGTFIPGAVLLVGGSTCVIANAAMNGVVFIFDDYYNSSYILDIISVSALSAGGALALVSIPILGSGYSKRNNAYKVYNKQCVSTKKSPLALNMTIGAGSLGLALSF